MREARVGSRSTCETRASLALGSGKSRGLEKTSGTRSDTQYAARHLALERPRADGTGGGIDYGLRSVSFHLSCFKARDRMNVEKRWDSGISSGTLERCANPGLGRGPGREFEKRSLQRHLAFSFWASSARMRCQRPVAHQSRYRLYAVSHLPYSVGIARHEAPERTTQRMPASTVRWSWRGRPVAGCCGGSSGWTRCHSASVSSARPRCGGRRRGRVVRSPVARASRGVAAGGDRLVSPAPPRPAEPERPPLRGLAHGQHQPPHLRHRERDQAGIGAPFSPRSSRRAARRRTTR